MADDLHLDAEALALTLMFRARSSILVALVVINAGCERQKQSAVRDVHSICGGTNWLRFSLPSSGFSVLLPTAPSPSIVTNATAAGPLVVSMFTSEVSPVVAFSVGRSRFPTNLDLSDTTRVFAGALKQTIGVESRLVYEKEVSLKGHPGREWRFTKFEGQAVFTVRLYLVGQEAFEAISVMPKSRVCLQQIRRFLDSCELN